MRIRAQSFSEAPWKLLESIKAKLTTTIFKSLRMREERGGEGVVKPAHHSMPWQDRPRTSSDGPENQGTNFQRGRLWCPQNCGQVMGAVRKSPDSAARYSEGVRRRLRAGGAAGVRRVRDSSFLLPEMTQQNKRWQKKDVTAWQKKEGCGREETSGNQFVCRRLAGQLCWQHLHKYFS